MILKTYAIKAAIYQVIVQNADYLAWVASEHPGIGSAASIVAEIGGDTPSDKVVMPAIRYRLVKNYPQQPPRTTPRSVTFDIYVESNTNSTDELDELLDLMRDVFLGSEGREFGVFTESANYKTAVGATDDELSLMVWDVKEIDRGEIGTGDPTFQNNAGMPLSMPNYHYGFSRFQMTVADARSIV